MRPIKNKQAKDMIADMLRREILSGAIPDGEELVQETMAELLGVSRIPVREAFQVLQAEGFLQRLPNRHVQVAGAAPQRVMENLGLVAAVESEAAILLAQRQREATSGQTVNARQPEALAELLERTAHHKAAAAEGRSQDCANLELEFHKRISELTGNDYLIHHHHSLLEGYPAYILQNCCVDFLQRSLWLQALAEAVVSCAADDGESFQAVHAACRSCFHSLAGPLAVYRKEKEAGHE